MSFVNWIDDDICWCQNSNECDDLKCYRNDKNRKTKEGLFTYALLKNTYLCPSYYEPEWRCKNDSY